MKIDQFLNGNTDFARGRKNLERMHGLVKDGKMKFIAGGPYEREYGHLGLSSDKTNEKPMQESREAQLSSDKKELTRLEQLEIEQSGLLQILNDREAEYSKLNSQMKGRESYEK